MIDINLFRTNPELVKENIPQAASPVKIAESSTPIVERSSPVRNTDLIDFQSVSNPPENSMNAKAMEPR